MKQLVCVNVGEDIEIELKEWHDEWMIIKKIKPVYIGKNGVSTDKHEGDRKTPAGLFKLGPAFGNNDIDIDYPFVKITNHSYFVDDKDSRFYNKWVEIGENISSNYLYIVNGEITDFKSAEHLIDYPIEYEFGLIIEYNMDNIDNTKGSAIFLHIKNNDYTEGCIAVNKKDMFDILKWLDKEKNPHILIQTIDK